ncbi:spherulation-specific family 4 protein [Allokutzneria sp. A3M-2-11 16]|uniref:spherulation-specific family 4 protein n=1 Tax=Allokutzneria sp. A3M-2-11 16 TaxID=2962043 RepID=UPI0020B662CB|nr:spherulation-specific family 4 protein [Allokutzneria sp. A3M-2-11 16]MCP3801456.1 spherulation-specific family 4 protein [Allokutzneria sp. A3M-2-11 16]
MSRLSRQRRVVPAYFHPAVAPEQWRALAALPALRFVVLNVADGPGARADQSFVDASAGLPVVGYVDTAYGARPVAEVLADVERHLAWYGARGVFFDQAGTDVRHYEALAAGARSLGADSVIFNHGTHPPEEFAALADLLVTFEGPLRAYRDLWVPRWVYRYPPELFCHLVYDAPTTDTTSVLRQAWRSNAAAVHVTDHCGENPWSRLPA